MTEPTVTEADIAEEIKRAAHVLEEYPHAVVARVLLALAAERDALAAERELIREMAEMIDDLQSEHVFSGQWGEVLDSWLARARAITPAAMEPPDKARTPPR